MTIVLKKKRQANFLITVQTLNLLKKQVPNKKQSEFVEQTLVKALKKNAFRDAVKNSFGAWKNHTENTEKYIRSLRESNRI
ncbi:hypothetical protein A3J23_02270 [Candidatus Peregrinibacteria bacterium RIFCSPLOWO2_02_FULL_48_14]|nr:MAG: hypothetical protein A3J23_02270 [Candidatus Peregrinibacteria bacterium RIFCSPLOWO2_02_FULL_48_14]